MSGREYINPKSVCAPPGSFHWAAKAGNTVYLAGQVGIDENGNTVGVGDAATQVKRAFSNIETTLRELGGDLDNLVSVTMFVVGRENLAGVRAGREEIIQEGRMTNKPPGTLLLVAGLLKEEWLVEVEATAVLD